MTSSLVNGSQKGVRSLSSRLPLHSSAAGTLPNQGRRVTKGVRSPSGSKTEERSLGEEEHGHSADSPALGTLGHPPSFSGAVTSGD